MRLPKSNETKRDEGVKDLSKMTREPIRVSVNRAWEPGNGTRYNLAIFEHPICVEHYVLCWLNAPPNVHNCMVWNASSGWLDLGYMLEQFAGISDADAIAIGAWFASQGLPFRL